METQSLTDEIERLREINRDLVRSHNGLLCALAKSESDAEALRDLFGPLGDVEEALLDVARAFDGAHVNANVVVGAVREALTP